MTAQSKTSEPSPVLISADKLEKDRNAFRISIEEARHVRFLRMDEAGLGTAFGFQYFITYLSEAIAICDIDLQFRRFDPGGSVIVIPTRIEGARRFIDAFSSDRGRKLRHLLFLRYENGDYYVYLDDVNTEKGRNIYIPCHQLRSLTDSDRNHPLYRTTEVNRREEES